MKKVILFCLIIFSLFIYGCGSNPEYVLLTTEKSAFESYADYIKYYKFNQYKPVDEAAKLLLTEKGIKIPPNSFITILDSTIEYRARIVVFENKQYFMYWK